MKYDKIYTDPTSLVGNTPLVEVTALEKRLGLKSHLLVKLESFNPGGSVKDRVALAMIEDAERRGVLRPGATIIEPTSGNTGIGLAWIGRAKGYDVILTMPDTMSVERRQLLAAYGAKLVLTPGSEGMNGAIRKAEELQREIPDSVILGQFSNPANPAVHEATTAPEIYRDTDGKVDIFIAGVGTGGTVSGTGLGLKSRKPDVEVIAVEPASSPVISGGKPGPHKIQGIGAGFIPKNYDAGVVDRVVTITDDEAMEGARLLSDTEGLLVGISSGAALQCAIREALKPENEGKTIVALMPDTGERYLSMGLFDR
ncbi:MAG: cysteine synthase A [Bacteroides sp.]|nr:cysteine synthase A [Barnesiella sp.]MBD5315507.1 cysteine synthase A [Bacteroides sp.]